MYKTNAFKNKPTAAEIAANRARLREIAASATTAIEAPVGVADLKEIDMPRGIPKKKMHDTVFVKFEPQVSAPPIIGTASRYAEFDLRVLSVEIGSSGKSSWMRFMFADKKSADNARTHLNKIRKDWAASGHTAEHQTVPDGDVYWLYVRRLRTKTEGGRNANHENGQIHSTTGAAQSQPA